MAFCDEALKAYPDMDEKHMGVTGGSYGVHYFANPALMMPRVTRLPS